MNHTIHHSKCPRDSNAWSASRRSAHWEQPKEVIAHIAGAALKRCFQWSLETE